MQVPQQMMGATVKNHYAKQAGIEKKDLFVVSVVPCIAKKYEAARPEFATDGIRDVDAVLTSSEMLRMLELQRIDISDIEPQEFDDPYKQVSGAGVLFGASGGVAEAALRMAVEKLTGKALVDHLDYDEVRGLEGMKEATVDAGDTKIRVAVISGLHNAEPIIDRIIHGTDVGYDLIEVMACPGGCICGAGHPVPEKVGTLVERQQVRGSGCPRGEDVRPVVWVGDIVQRRCLQLRQRRNDEKIAICSRDLISEFVPDTFQGSLNRRLLVVGRQKPHASPRRGQNQALRDTRDLCLYP
jgi:iron only hydrogenase large subunit-like protein